MTKLILVSACLAVLLSPYPAKGDDLTMTHAEGEYWKYTSKRESVYSRSDAIPKEFTIVFKGGVFVADGYDDVPASIRIVPTVHGVSITMPWFKLPPKVGDEWEYTDPKDATRKSKFKTEAIETVSVPAGTFETYKIVRLLSTRVSSIETTYFFSLQTKSVVKEVFKATVKGGGGATIEVELAEHGIRGKKQDDIVPVK